MPEDYPFDSKFGSRLKRYLQTKDTTLRKQLVENEIDNIVNIIKAELEQDIRVENIKDLENVQKGEGVLIGKVGAKKRMEIIKKANEMKLKILNKYRKPKE